MVSNLVGQFGSGSSGIGALGINGQSFVIQLITFIIAFLVLRKWAFKPIIKVLHERRETIESGVKLGEELRKEREALAKKVEDELRQARQEADGIVAQAQESGRQTIREAEDKARVKAANIVAEAEARIAQETAGARRQLEKELVGLIADTTEAIIDEKVDVKKDAAFIERALQERRAA